MLVLPAINLQQRQNAPETSKKQLQSTVIAYLKYSSLKKQPVHLYPRLNNESMQLEMLSTEPRSNTRVVIIQKGPQKSGLSLALVKKSQLGGKVTDCFSLVITSFQLTLKQGLQKFNLQNLVQPEGRASSLVASFWPEATNPFQVCCFSFYQLGVIYNVWRCIPAALMGGSIASSIPSSLMLNI